MDVEIRWHSPIPLRRATEEFPILSVPRLKSLPESPGIYVFGRLTRKNFVPIYIGKAENIRARVSQQLNNARLMVGIKKSPGRKRVIAIGELDRRRGQRLDATLALVERSLIEYATLEGYDLLNQMGTSLRRVHTVSFHGNRLTRSWLGDSLTIRRRRRPRRG